jgi:cytochrome c556
MKLKCMGTLLLAAAIAFAQAPSEPFPPAASVKQLMLDLIHPSSNDILLAIYRGGPAGEQRDEKEWAAVRRSAVTLAESGNLLMMRGRARDQGDWMKDAKLLVDAGNAAYKAALAKDGNALAAVAGALDAACTTCHKQYRPNVFPKDGGSK